MYPLTLLKKVSLQDTELAGSEKPSFRAVSFLSYLLNCFFFPEKNSEPYEMHFLHKKISPYNTPVIFRKSQPNIFIKKNCFKYLDFFIVLCYDFRRGGIKFDKNSRM